MNSNMLTIDLTNIPKNYTMIKNSHKEITWIALEKDGKFRLQNEQESE